MDTDSESSSAPVADLGNSRGSAVTQRKRSNGMTTSEVRLSTAKSGRTSLLEVTTTGRRSVLANVRALLFRLRVQIIKVDCLVRDEGIFERFEIAEEDGREITRRRAATIRSVVRKALGAKNARDAAA